MDYEIVDIREMTPKEMSDAIKMNETVFKINHTIQNSEEYDNLLKELFGYQTLGKSHRS